MGLIKLGKKLLAVGCRCLAVPSRPLTVRSRHQPLSSRLRAQAGECLHGVLHPRVGAPELVGDVVQLPIVRLGGGPVALGSHPVAPAGHLVAVLCLLGRGDHGLSGELALLGGCVHIGGRLKRPRASFVSLSEPARAPT